MMRFTRHSVLLVSLLIVTLSSLSLVPIFAQDNTTIITVAIDEFQQDFLNDEAFAAFEEANPGVDVVTVILSNEERYFGAPQDVEGISDFAESVNNLASQADLLPIDTFNGPRLRTRIGMYLDITPLVNADPDANLEDFYPAMLESMQWDGGIWGLPLSGSVQVVIFDTNAFDEAGLAYPNTSWTLRDFITAGEILSQFDDEGNVDIPGFFGFDTAGLFTALLDSDLVDPASFPALPLLNTPENVEFVELWANYRADYYPDFSQGLNFDFNEIPLTINSTFLLNDEFNFGSSDANFEGVLLPGNRALLSVQSYAISSGTSNPQLAYELLQYMSSTPEIAYSFFGDAPARQSLQTVDTSDLPIFRPEFPEDVQSLLDEALLNAIPASQTHFTSYIDAAANRVNSDENPVDAEVALQEIQEEVTDVLLEVENFSASNVVEVATPVPTPVLQAGEVALTFGLESNFGPGADRDIWTLAIDEFVAQDPQVGQITLNSEFLSFEERVEEQDCFYLASNIVQGVDLTQVFPIDPFLTTDPNVDFNNFVNGTIEQVTRENSVYAMPLSITPSVMWYNTEIFAEAGLAEPTNDWTIFEFVDALNTLDATTDGEPYLTQSFDGSYFYMLVAAFGGLPIDSSTTPITVNIDDPATIEAMRQVVDLIDSELIAYRELSGFGGGGFGGGGSALFDAIISPNDFRLQNRTGEFADPHRVVMFPRGTAYTPVSYQMGVGMISANTPAPDACYRWLSFLTDRPELLNGMPTQVDQFEAAVANFDNADDVVAVYNAFNEALQDPNVVIVESGFNTASTDPVAGTNTFLTRNWINTAIDNIVLEDVDIETALSDAQTFINEYYGCIDGIEPLDRPVSELDDDESQEYFSQFIRCAIAVDPSLDDVFGGFIEDEEDE